MVERVQEEEMDYQLLNWMVDESCYCTMLLWWLEPPVGEDLTRQSGYTQDVAVNEDLHFLSMITAVQVLDVLSLELQVL